MTTAAMRSAFITQASRRAHGPGKVQSDITCPAKGFPIVFYVPGIRYYSYFQHSTF